MKKKNIQFLAVMVSWLLLIIFSVINLLRLFLVWMKNY